MSINLITKKLANTHFFSTDMNVSGKLKQKETGFFSPFF